jgi:hypothetical protein
MHALFRHSSIARLDDKIYFCKTITTLLSMCGPAPKAGQKSPQERRVVQLAAVLGLDVKLLDHAARFEEVLF